MPETPDVEIFFSKVSTSSGKFKPVLTIVYTDLAGKRISHEVYSTSSAMGDSELFKLVDSEFAQSILRTAYRDWEIRKAKAANIEMQVTHHVGTV